MAEIILDKMSTGRLLKLFADIIETLYRRRVIRTSNNPAADYAEYLVCRTLNLERAGASEKGHDATDRKGQKYEIKARRMTPHNKPTRFSAIRQLDEHHFDYLVAVLFENDFKVSRASIIPYDEVERVAFWQQHVNAHIMPISDTIWELASAKDITNKLNEGSRNL